MHNHKSGRELQSRRCFHTTVISWHPPRPKLKFTLQWVIGSISLEAWCMKNSLQTADCFLSFWTSVLLCSHDRFYYFWGQLERNSNQKAIHCAQFSPHSFHWWGNDCQIGRHVASQLLGLSKRMCTCHSLDTCEGKRRDLAYFTLFAIHFWIIFFAFLILIFAQDNNETT